MRYNRSSSVKELTDENRQTEKSYEKFERELRNDYNIQFRKPSPNTDSKNDFISVNDDKEAMAEFYRIDEENDNSGRGR